MAKRKKASDGFYRERFKYNDQIIDVRSLDEKELEAKIQQRKNEIDQNGNARIKASKMRLSEWADIWLETYYKPSVKHYTYTLAQGYVKNYIKPELGQYRISEIRPLDMQSFLNRHADKKMSFMSHLRSLLDSIMSQAVINQFIAVNPVSEVKAPKCKYGSHRDITAEERRLLLAVCAYKPERAIFLTMLYLGCSPQEAKALKVENVNVNDHTVEIKEAIISKTTISGDTKTEYRLRVIPIPDELYDTFISVLPNEGIIFRTEIKRYADGKYYKGGKAYSEKALAKRWKDTKKDMQALINKEAEKRNVLPAKLAEDFTMYCLRHTYATDLMSAGVPLFIAKNLMGHKDTRMLEQIYGHRRPDQLASAKSLIDKYNARRAAGEKTEKMGVKMGAAKEKAKE